MSEPHAKELAEALSDGDKLPAVIAIYDGENYWLADGFHREYAHRLAGIDEIEVDVRQGDKRDAILYSVGANANHGLKRTGADKHRAVLRLLNDAEWSQWSSRQIARMCKVSHTLVNILRPTTEIAINEAESGEPARRKFVNKHGGISDRTARNAAPEPDPLPTAVVKTSEGVSARVVDNTISNGNIFKIECVDSGEESYLRRNEFTVVEAAEVVPKPEMEASFPVRAEEVEVSAEQLLLNEGAELMGALLEVAKCPPDLFELVEGWQARALGV